MAIELDKMNIEQLAVELGLPEGSERYQKAKAELTYRQLKGQIAALEQGQLAVEVQRETIAVQKAAIGVQREALGVQKAAAEAEAKAAEASIASAKAAENNAKYLL